MPNNLAVSYGQPSGYPNPTFFLGSFATDPVNTSPGQWWYNTTTGQIKGNINGSIQILNTISIGYPNPTFFLGNFSTDPANTSSGQWWYNTTTMQIKENINGSIQILGAFASSFSSTTYITQDTTIGGQGITVNYVDLVITNNATLTIAAGSNVNVAGALNITAGASLVLQGATLNIYNALQNAGTFQSTSASDSIQAVQVQNTGVMQIDGTLYLPSAGYNHILAGTISGTGTLNIQGTAVTLIGDQLSLSISTVNGSGTYQIQQNGVCTINGNIAMSVPNVTGTGTVSIASGNTLTVNGNATYSISSLSGAGGLTVASGYTMTFSGTSLTPSTLTVSGTLALSGNYTIPTNITVPTGTGTLSIGSTYTLTINANLTSSLSFAGAGTLTVASGYTLTQGSAITLSVSTVNIAGTWANAGYGITVPSGSTVLVNVTGSVTTASTAGTLTVDGTVFWYGSGISPQAINAVPIFTLKLAGTGIFLGSPTYTKGTATTAISLSSTAIQANAGDGSATGSGKIPYMAFTSVTGSAAGKYGIGIFNSTAATYAIFILIYVGGTSAFSIPSGYYLNYTTADTSGDTIEVFNASGSAGTITLTGTAYV